MDAKYFPKFRPIRQGQFDGFCGLYAIANFASLRSGEDRYSNLSQRAFRLALKSVESHDDLSSNEILKGFRQGQLRRAAETVSETLKLGVKIVTLANFQKQNDANTVFDLILCLQGNEAVMLRFRNPNHWVLACRAADGEVALADSSEQGRCKRLTKEIVVDRNIELKRGLVFLNA